MNELKFSWSRSTIKIFLDNTNESKAPELIYHKEYIEQLLGDLRDDYKMMFEDFGEDDETVKKYFVAINEIRDWLEKKLALTIPVVSKSVTAKDLKCPKCKQHALMKYIDRKECTSCGYVC